MHRKVPDICNDILQDSKVVLFVDTCVVLNIVNSLFSDELGATYAVDALTLLKAHGKRVWLTTSQNVTEEWNDNVDAVMGTLSTEISRVERNVAAMINVGNELLHASHPLPPALSRLGVQVPIRSLSETFLRTCLSIERIHDYSIRAMDRVRKGVAPAGRGKQEAKDCEIVECFLHLGRELRNAGFKDRLLFFTANKKDFGTTSQVKPPLDCQFKQMGAELVTNIEQARAIVEGRC